MNGGPSRSKFGSLLGVLYVGHTSCKFLVSILLRFKDDYRFDCETTIFFFSSQDLCGKECRGSNVPRGEAGGDFATVWMG